MTCGELVSRPGVVSLFHDLWWASEQVWCGECSMTCGGLVSRSGVVSVP